jgi:hypothetical protein
MYEAASTCYVDLAVLALNLDNVQRLLAVSPLPELLVTAIAFGPRNTSRSVTPGW